MKPIPCLPSISFPIIVVIEELFFIKCSIHDFLLNFSTFHIDFLMSIVLNTASFFTFSDHDTCNVFFSIIVLQKLLIGLLAFWYSSSLWPYKATLYTYMFHTRRVRFICYDLFSYLRTGLF